MCAGKSREPMMWLPKIGLMWRLRSGKKNWPQRRILWETHQMRRMMKIES
jgi:hypothetical protein